LHEEIRSGRATQERKLEVCAGPGLLSPEDRVELLAILASDTDPTIRETAAAALLTQPLPNVLGALARQDAAPEMFAYCAAEFPRRPGVADALGKNRACPIEVLRPVVRYLSTTALQELFEDLDRLSTSPALVAALIASDSLSADQRSQLLELQKEELDPQEAFKDAADAAGPDAAKRQTLLQKLAHMRVAERVQLALKGTREERMVLSRDPSKVVQRAVLQSPQLTEQEVEGFAAMASLSDEILRLIAMNRKYRRNYTIVRNLMFNPNTPLEITLHMLPNITAQDLKLLMGNKNVPDTLRTSAMRLHRVRTQGREGS
jgi:hypothetical protein